MSDRPCMLNPDKWRVAQCVVPVPARNTVVRPWQLEALAPAPLPGVQVSLWGVWPPQWDIEGPPMLMFPTNCWHMAFRAAYDRAEFDHVPAPPSSRDPMTEGPF